MTPAERVLKRIEHRYSGLSTPCWCWTGQKNWKGYGEIGQMVRGQRFGLKVHRVVYEALVGPIPTGHHLDHLCEVKECVNPLHLEPVTPLENNWRNILRHSSATRTHCKRGHLRSEHTRTTRSGKTYCHPCMLLACARNAKKSHPHSVGV